MPLNIHCFIYNFSCSYMYDIYMSYPWDINFAFTINNGKCMTKNWTYCGYQLSNNELHKYGRIIPYTQIAKDKHQVSLIESSEK